MHGSHVNKAERKHAPVPASASRNGVSPTAVKLARRLGLHYVSSEALSIRRRRRGKGWIYLAPNGRVIRHRAVVRRLASLAVPPAYHDVLYAEDPAAHLQAIGRDDAGRLQYRYHPDWEKVRETRKAGRLARLADALPRIRRSAGQHLSGEEPTREFALAAVIELVASSAIRPGSESYTRQHGSRGATTLLKSNVARADVSRQRRKEGRQGGGRAAHLQSHRAVGETSRATAVPVSRRGWRLALHQSARGQRVFA